MKALAGVFLIWILSLSLSGQTYFGDYNYSSFFGGDGTDIIEDVAVDSTGRIYLLGTTSTDSFDYPSSTQFGYQGGFSDVFIAMLSPDGVQVLEFTYYGGQGRDEARSIAITQNQDIVITGVTNSSQLPNTAFSYKNTLTDGVEAFTARFPNGLTSLQSATFLGGTANGFDAENVAVVEKSNNDLLFSFSASSELTYYTVAEDSAHGNADVIVLDLHAVLVGGNMATFIGGNDQDYFGGMAQDEQGNIYVSGWTLSNDLDVSSGAVQDTNSGGTDAFVASLGSDLTMTNATYFGGSEFDQFSDLQVTPSGTIVAAGISYSDSLGDGIPGLRSRLGFNIADIIVANFSSDLTAVNQFTYLGGSNLDYLNDMELAGNGDILLAGSTISSNFPITVNNAYDVLFGAPEEGYAMQINSELDDLKSSTYIGDTLNESCEALALGKNGNVIQVGFTTSSLFQLSANAQDITYAGLSEGFIVISEGMSTGMDKPAPTQAEIDIIVAGNRTRFDIPAGDWKLKVYDVMGRNVYATALGQLPKGTYEKSLPLKEKGFYILQLVSSESVVAQKFYFAGNR